MWGYTCRLILTHVFELFNIIDPEMRHLREFVSPVGPPAIRTRGIISLLVRVYLRPFP